MEMKLKEQRPASGWSQVFPLGNGQLGAMVWGGVGREQLGLNEESIWSGTGENGNNPGALAHLEECRQLIREGHYAAAQDLMEEKMLGTFGESYLPLGTLFLTFSHGEGEPADYCRTLSLDDALAEVSYTLNGIHCKRRYLVSRPHRILAMELVSSAPLDIRAEVETPLLVDQRQIREDGVEFTFRCPEHVDPIYIKDRYPIVWGTNGKRVPLRLWLLETDGQFTTDEAGLTITGSCRTVLALSAVTLPETLPDWDELLAAHLADYQPRYNRVTLELGLQLDLPTSQRLADLKAGKEDNGLYALYFQYGRYLLISSSGENCDYPPNLQGIWSWEMRAPWSSNFTTNINTQMNVWPALSCGVDEALIPYFRLLRRLVKRGQETAQVYFDCRGFCVAHNVDGWDCTNLMGIPWKDDKAKPGSAVYGFYTMAGGWMCQELWKQYRYHPDNAFLEQEVLPILAEAARFYCDFLIEHDGWLATCPSASPENHFIDPETGRSVAISMATTMDMTIIREVFRHYLEGCEILGHEDELTREIQEKLPRLYPYQLGKEGQLLEWYRDFEESEPGHRHLSHLYGLFPGDEFAGDKKLEEACRVSLKRRIASGGGHTGWSCAWIINLFAILGDQEGAWQFLQTLLKRSTMENLWDDHPPFQIDGNFGGTAAIANMLVHEWNGELRILPAIPPAWKEGKVTGLRISGNRAVDIIWSENQVHSRTYSLEERA